MQETPLWGRSPGEGSSNRLQNSCLENSTEEPGRLQSVGSQRVVHDWVTEHACTFTKKSLQSPSQMKILYLACRTPSSLVPKSLSSRSLLSTHLMWLLYPSGPSPVISFLGHSTTHKLLNSSFSYFLLVYKGRISVNLFTNIPQATTDLGTIVAAQ